MANTSAQFVLQTLSDILSYKNGTGSVNFYMAHGGSNFGYWAGELPVARRRYHDAREMALKEMHIRLCRL